jgi:hypothetical protein
MCDAATNVHKPCPVRCAYMTRLLLVLFVLLVRYAMPHYNRTLPTNSTGVFKESSAPFAVHRRHHLGKQKHGSAVSFLKLAMVRTRKNSHGAILGLFRLYKRMCDGRFERMVEMLFNAKMRVAKRRVEHFEELGVVLARLRKMSGRV